MFVLLLIEVCSKNCFNSFVLHPLVSNKHLAISEMLDTMNTELNTLHIYLNCNSQM